MSINTSVLYLPRPATSYPGCYPLHFEKHIPHILNTNNYIQVFAGKCCSGLKVDIKEETNPHIVADAHKLPMASNSVEGAIADPPYTKEFARELYGTKYPKWSVWVKELTRVVIPGGMIAIMQNYIVPRLPECEMQSIVVILTRIKQFPKIVTVQRKRGPYLIP